MMMKVLKIKWLRSVMLVAIALMVLCGCGTQKEENRFVTIDGKAQHIRDLGSGKPVVVFVTGFGDDLNAYDSIQRAVSKVTRTISYDRAGLGKSELTTKNRSLDTLVSELDEILQAENIPAPYILVGHSYGGHIARYYAHLHPEKISGMVLIDPSVEFLDTEIRRLKTPDEVRQYDSLFEFGRDPSWPEGLNNEADYFRVNEAMMRDKKIQFPDVPVTVITAMNMPESGHSFLRGASKIKIDLHHRWTVETPRVHQVLAEKSGHYVHYDDPILVINEIKAVISGH